MQFRVIENMTGDTAQEASASSDFVDDVIRVRRLRDQVP